jgi:hypothetical protein
VAFEIVDDGLLAVVAHELLNNLCVTSGNLALLVDSWELLSESSRRLMIEGADRHAQLAVEILAQLARGLPATAESAPAA